MYQTDSEKNIFKSDPTVRFRSATTEPDSYMFMQKWSFTAKKKVKFYELLYSCGKKQL